MYVPCLPFIFICTVLSLATYIPSLAYTLICNIPSLCCYMSRPFHTLLYVLSLPFAFICTLLFLEPLYISSLSEALKCTILSLRPYVYHPLPIPLLSTFPSLRIYTYLSSLTDVSICFNPVLRLYIFPILSSVLSIQSISHASLLSLSLICYLSLVLNHTLSFVPAAHAISTYKECYKYCRSKGHMSSP